MRFARLIFSSLDPLDPSRLKRKLDDTVGWVDQTRRRDGPALSPVYFCVARKKLSRTEVRNLDSSADKETDSTNCSASVSQLVQVGSFANVDDKRQNLIVHRHDHANMHNIRTSFDPSTLITPPARGHKVLHPSVDGTDVELNSPSVFMLFDKNFPPVVPAGGGGGGGVFENNLVENRSLSELVEVFLVRTWGFNMPTGTEVLLGSTSYAAITGTAHYTAKFVPASGQLRGAFAGGVNILHGISSFWVACITQPQLGHWPK